MLTEWDLADQLQQWGPDSTQPAPDLVFSREYCSRLAKLHYENFPVSSWLVPQSARPHLQAVYAFCRWADDLGDAAPESYDRSTLLQWWRTQLYACYEGACRHPVYVALKETIEQCHLPIEPFDRLIEAFLRDQQQPHYDSYADLLTYCSHSANPVGELVLRVFGQATDQSIVYSNRICTALQLTNFWQDVKRDLAIGRIYLPAEDRTTFGVTPEMLHQSKSCLEVKNLIRFQVDRTRELMLEGRPLLMLLKGRLKLEVHAIMQGGLKVLQSIKEQDYDVLSHRPKLSKWHLIEIGLLSLWSLSSVYRSRLQSHISPRKEQP